MALKFDLHSHSFFSSDGISTPEEMIAVARKKGLDGMAITDHNNCDSVNYLLDRGLMREDGQPVNGFLLIPGVEVTTIDGHLLCLGAVLPQLRGLPALDVCHEIHARGGLAIPPHSYDCFRSGISESVMEKLPIDALEVFNAATTLHRHNQKALNYAKERGLGMIACSDAHHASVVGTAYSILETEDFSLAGVMAAIPQSRLTVERYLGFKDSLRKTLANVRRLQRRRRLIEALGTGSYPGTNGSS